MNKHHEAFCVNSKPCFDCEYPLETQAEQEQAFELLEKIAFLIENGQTTGEQDGYKWQLNLIKI